MNSNEIVCFIDIFSIYQKVQYSDGQEEQISLANLPGFLPQVCSAESINKIHLYGDTAFCNGVADKIRANEITIYGENNLEIEVN